MDSNTIFANETSADQTNGNEAADTCSSALIFKVAPCLSKDGISCVDFIHPNVSYQSIISVQNVGNSSSCSYKVKFQIEPDGFFTQEDTLTTFEVFSDEAQLAAGEQAIATSDLSRTLPKGGHFNLKAWIYVNDVPLCDKDLDVCLTEGTYQANLNLVVEDNEESTDSDGAASSAEVASSEEATPPETSGEATLFNRQTDGALEDPANTMSAFAGSDATPGGGGGTSSVVDPFPHAIVMSLDMFNVMLGNCIEAASQPADVRDLCGAVIDLTGDPDLPPYVGHNDTDMLYVGSLAKIYPLLAAFELRRRVNTQANDMIKLGLSTAVAGWQNRVFTELRNGWQPQLDAAFQGRGLPSGPQQHLRFPDLAKIVQLSPDGTRADRAIAELRDPFLDDIRAALKQNDEAAAGRYIRALSYPYINGVLAAAGFFKPADRTGLWISGDYNGNDWLPKDGAGQPLTPRWRLPGHPVSNFTGTALQVARFLGLMAQGKLIDSASSVQMISLLGIPWLFDTLSKATPMRPFTSADGKVGIGEWDTRFHDGAIVRIERGGDPTRTISYAVVVLGSPSNDIAPLRKLELAYHDCILAGHP